jgi:hypothetical protein
MKVRLTGNWCNDEVLYNRFNRVYVSKLNINSNVEFTLDDDFDLLVIFNNPCNYNGPKVSKENILGVILEPEWSCEINRFHHILSPVCSYILHHKPHDSSQYIYYPGLLPFHMDYDTGENLDYYIETKFKKSKNCSFIVSYMDGRLSGSSIYHQRINFAKKILNSDLDIDIYGNNWDQCNISDKRIKGPLQNKKDGLIDYNFSIAIENCIEDDYFTEKLTDCILTDATPIYYGCPNIERFMSGIYQLDTLDTIDTLSEILKSSNTIDQVTNKRSTATKFNLYTAITNFITRHE